MPLRRVARQGGMRTTVTPEEVLREPGLTEDEKADLLCRLAYDAAELDVALEEGMPGDESDLQQRVLLALNHLGRSIDREHTGPTKQHGVFLS